MKKATSILLALLLALLCCAPGLAQEAPAEPGSITYPIPTDTPVTLWYNFWMHGAAGQFISSFDENEAWQEIQKKTGIDITWTHPVLGQEQENFNLLVASGELPDLVGEAARYQGGVEAGVADGLFLDLTELMPIYAPDYYAYATANDDIKREMTTEDGRFVAFYTMRTVDTPSDPPWCRINVRADWLEEFGMDTPKTYEELEAYFQAVLDNKPGVTPLIYPPVNNWMGEIISAGYNVIPDWMVVDGQVSMGTLTPAYKEYLTRVADWYQKGYISPDFASYDLNQQMGEFTMGNAGAILDSVDVTFQRSKTMDFEVESLPYTRLNTPEDEIHTSPREAYNHGWETAISTQCKYPEIAMMFMNYLYTDEGADLMSYGVEGSAYTVDENGQKLWTEAYTNPEKWTMEGSGYIMKNHFGTKRWVPDHVTIKAEGESGAAQAAFRAKWSDDPNADDAYRLPPIKLTTEETTERAAIMVDLNTYIDEMEMKFIMGLEPLDNWDNYVKTATEDYRYDEAQAITQAAYDRYMSN